jgi:predicted class III extradiol MEMO1 family dioxygenase
MKKEKKIMSKASDFSLQDHPEVTQETDQEIIDKINKRKKENQALKKLLDNLNSSCSKTDTKL